MADPVAGDIPEDYFAGGGRLATRELARIINASGNLVRSRHKSIVAVGKSTSSPGQGPQPTVYGSTFLLTFTPDTDDAFRQFKIPGHFSDSPAVHIHWTKTGDGDESGLAVLWRVSYHVFPGSGQDINVAPSVVETEVTYDDAGTTTRVMQRTADLELSGFVANWYCAVKVEAITPVGSPMVSEPSLFSLDLTYNERINR